MLSRISLWVLAGLTVVALCGCGSGGDSTGARLAIVSTGATRGTRAAITRHTASGTVLVITLPSGRTIEVDKARFGVSEFDFDDPVQAVESEGSGADDDDIEIRGPFIVDLVNRQFLNPDGSSASSIFAEFPAGTVFEEAEFDIDPAPGVDADGREIVSIYIHGTLRETNGTPILSFRLTSKQDEELEFEGESSGGVMIDPGTNVFAVVFSMSGWFTGIDLTTADRSGANIDANGDVLLDDSHNSSLRGEIVSRIRDAIDFFEDDDQDGDAEDDF